MTQQDWERFFESLGKIVQMPDKTWEEKRQEVYSKASELGGETDLGEFASWFRDYGPEDEEK